MTACQTAVTNELEAKAVLKETEAALDKAMKESEALESSQELDEDEEKEEGQVSDVSDADEPPEKTKTRMEAEGSSRVLMPGVEVPSAPPAEKKEKRKEVYTEEKQHPAVLFLKKHGVAVGTVLLFAAASVVFLQSSTGKTLLASAGGFFSKLSYHLGQLWHYIIPSSHAGEEGFLQTIWLLLMSVVMVPLVLKGIPGGTPILGFLIAGALVGPHALGIVKNMEGVHMLGELGVVFLLFNIGLELSLERLRSMAKLVFGLGTAQVLVTILAVAMIAVSQTGVSGSAAIVVGCALALSSTAVAMQVLQDRGENGSRHGRATFSVLLLQDLAVVVVLIMIPLLAPKNGAMAGGIHHILKILGTAAVKAAVCITGIIVGGRVLLRPIYRSIAGFENKEIFAALTLLVVLGASKLTEVSGLSLALGAFLAGLLLAETEYVLQVESDIAPYEGLLMGLFFMTVGMEISVGPLFAQWKSVLTSLTILLAGKVAIMAAVGPCFGLSRVTAIRSGLLLAAGGEFAFVTLGEAEVQGILPSPIVNQIYLVVALSMALLPYLAILGGKLGQLFEKSDMRAMQPRGEETGSQKGHVIIAGFGRVGSLIAGLLSERLIPYVALDVHSDRVQNGKALDLPVYFGDAGSQAVLQSVGAQNAACIVVALDSPGANYRCVWAASRHFPHVPIYVRARDVDHARNLAKAGASVVVPETLEPSLQLAASVLSQTEVSTEEVGVIIDSYRRTHFAELASLARETGYSMGYGFSQMEDGIMEEDDDLDTAALGTAAAPEGA
ncbi:unnamed protein product [Ostreobium quekettii]|uniref:RCK N-terminal domain-containing protein n=1 Tax=Ostreobium quekettii TaxID=121088 RepID=A0A8S1JFB4_9CHLO|nr:unnamed protein product [Ostreobium quekettii]